MSQQLASPKIRGCDGEGFAQVADRRVEMSSLVKLGLAELQEHF